VIFFDKGNPKKDTIPEYKPVSVSDERPIFRDRIPREDFGTAFSKNDITNQFVDQIRRLFDSMGKFGIDYYKETKEKKEIE
jgi:hypothetical protein